ncbi:peptidase M14 family protein [Candidatus Bathyarchaeota archaeon]|nr:MAG: peptidase M14 family protein [Candidatus Bathyarchaeota archaeon]
MSTDIPSPEEFFGHKMGADRRLVRWDRIVEYFWTLDRSPCVKVTELGRSTEGNPFLLAIVSSPENIENAEAVREMSYRIAHPKGLTEAEAGRIIREGKTVVAMTMSIHATEVGGTQMAPELAYELATSPDLEEVRRNTVLLLFPCFNPDGQIKVVDWYSRWLGTEYEGVPTPFLYHKYTGHDNNRDAIHLTQVESKMVSRVLYREWYPQAYIDHHHMGSYGARFYIPPFANPIDPNVDPLVWTEQELYGGMMAVMLEEAGKTGVESAATYPGEFMPTFNYVPCWHNICGMLTESASAKLATPIYVHYHQLKPSRRGRPEYRAQMGFPHPWPGGWWRLRDIVEQQKISALATLRVAAAFREMILRNMYLKARRSIEAGVREPPYAFIVKPRQHDELTAYKLLRMLMEMGVEVSRSRREFTADGVTYPRGTFVIFTSQSCRPYIISLLRRTFYHAGPFSRRPDGTPIAPYDLSTYTVAEFMGVDLHEVEEPFDGSFETLTSIRLPRGSVEEGRAGYLLDCALNESYAAVNRLLKRGREVHRLLEAVKAGDKTFEAGSFFIPGQPGLEEELRRLSKRHHLVFAAAPSSGLKTKPVRMLRVGVYQRYWGGNIDEGWTRWLLEQYRFRYKTLRDADIKRGKLRDKYDVIVLPSDQKCLILGEGIEEYYEKRFKGLFVLPKFPPEYRSGLGKEGVEKLKEFVEAGGVLVALGESSNFAIDELKLPVKNVLADLKPDEFLCPGSTLHVNVNKDHPLTYGVSDALLILFRNHPAFEVKAGMSNEDMQVVLSYPDERIMESGWLVGEKHLSRKAALIDAKLGEGRVVLFGFSPQFRAQTDATFKLFFNCLLG